MTRRWSIPLGFAVSILLALSPSAQGQDQVGVALLIGAPAKILSETTAQVSARGQIVVSFHGDGASGCAANGLCPYSGTIVVRPGSGAFGVVIYRQHGRIARQVSLFLTPRDGQYYTAAHVERLIAGQPPGTCGDTESNPPESPTVTTHGGEVTIRLFAATGSTLSTRCAGPLDADLAGVGPTATIPLKRLIRGRITVNLTGTRSFASHGFAGTVVSTLVLTLGKPSKNSTQPRFPPGIKTTRIRTVSEQLTLTRLTGGLTTTIQGVTNPLVCRLLDSCGMTGTIAFGPTAHEFSGGVTARGPAGRPERDFLAALGLAAGNPKGIAVGVFGAWIEGPVTADVTQSGTCTDSAPGGAMFMTLAAGRDQLRGFASATSSRTRCPGPNFSPQGNPLLDAALPRSALGHRTFTIGLRPAGPPMQDDGYTMAIHGHLSLVVRRGRITQQVFAQPTG